MLGWAPPPTQQAQQGIAGPLAVAALVVAIPCNFP